VAGSGAPASFICWNACGVEAAKNGTVIDENKTVLDLEARLETCMTVTAPAPGQKLAPGPSSSAPAPPAPVTSARQTYQISWTPGEDLFQRGLNPLKLLEEMGRLGTVTSCVLATSRLPDLADLDPERCYLSWKCMLETDYPREDIESVFEFTAPPGGLTITALNSSSPVAQPKQEPDPERWPFDRAPRSSPKSAPARACSRWQPRFASTDALRSVKTDRTIAPRDVL
jgi:two-component system chemotaxis sensor kinase CheA